MAHLKKSEREDIKTLISVLYKKAGRSWGDRHVNHCVAEDIAIMIDQARKTTKSFAWITPSPGKPSVRWLLGLIVRGLIAEMRNEITPTAARAVLLVRGWDHRLQISSTVCFK